MQAVQEDGYRESINTTAGGEAIIFQNGEVIKARWKKPSRSAPLQLIDTAGKDIELVRGQTWITAVPNVKGGVSWQ